jgi:hypothetical protein
MISKTMLMCVRAALVLLFLGSLFVQLVMVPLVAYNMDPAQPGMTDLRIPVLVIVFLGVATAQVVMVGVWRLLTMVYQSTILSRTALPSVDAISLAIAAAAGLMWMLGVVAAPGEEVAPGMVLLIGGAGAALAAVALLVRILATVLAFAADRHETAIRLQTELDAHTSATPR